MGGGWGREDVDGLGGVGGVGGVLFGFFGDDEVFAGGGGGCVVFGDDDFFRGFNDASEMLEVFKIIRDLLCNVFLRGLVNSWFDSRRDDRVDSLWDFVIISEEIFNRFSLFHGSGRLRFESFSGKAICDKFLAFFFKEDCSTTRGVCGG